MVVFFYSRCSTQLEPCQSIILLSLAFAQGLYVVHIFPPCEFSYDQLLVAAPELHQSLLHTQMPHLLIVITTV